MPDVTVRSPSGSFPAMLLKWTRNGGKALITYELDGRVVTEWVDAELIEPLEPA